MTFIDVVDDTADRVLNFLERWDDVVFWVFWLTVIGGLIGGTVWSAIAYDRYQCGQISRQMQVGYTYSPSTGCMVQIDNQWVQLGAVRKEAK